MAHWITGLIGPSPSMDRIAGDCGLGVPIALRQGLSLVLIEHHDVERLAGPSDRNGDEDEGRFDYASDAWMEVLRQLSKDTKLAYIETRYFGGQGAMAFQNGEVALGPLYQSTFADEKTWPINRALSLLGVKADDGALDEFEAVGLDDHRMHPEVI